MNNFNRILFNLSLLSIILIFTDYAKGQAILVKDLTNTEIGFNTQPISLSTTNGKIFFSAVDPNHGRELWISDGTELGTHILKDINPGLEGTIIGDLLAVDGNLYFSANDGVHGEELWQSDGTEEGTVMIADISPGKVDSKIIFMSKLGDAIYFTTLHGQSTGRLRKLSLTSGKLETIGPDTNLGIQSITAIGNKIVFSAHDYENSDTKGSELWVSDGTTEGTFLLKDINEGSDHSIPSSFEKANGLLFFTANHPDYGRELWVTDGTTTGTNLLFDLNPGSASSDSRIMGSTGNFTFLHATNVQGNRELWKTDGTEAGTTMIKEVPIQTFQHAILNENIYFITEDNKLWVSDGTTEGTKLFNEELNINFRLIRKSEAFLFFEISRNLGSELWRSDGSLEGTFKVADFQELILNTTSVDDNLYFSGVGINETAGKFQLWKSDGSEDGTTVVNRVTSVSTDIKALASFNGKLIFGADTGLGLRIWSSEGENQNTAEIIGENNGSTLAYNLRALNSFVELDEMLLFPYKSNEHGMELWRTDGTESGTTIVKDIASGTSSSQANFICNYNGLAYFFANDQVHGNEVWVTDGTPDNTNIFLDSSTEEPGVIWGDIVNVNNSLILSLGKPTISELYISDGTLGGTKLLKEFGSVWYPSLFTATNEKIFFLSLDGSFGSLWVTDGTSTGTTKVQEIMDSGDYISATLNRESKFAELNNELYYVNKLFSGFGAEIWKTDGTANGTELVKEIVPGKQGSHPKNLTNFKGNIFFTAGDNDHGRELWKTDGTVEGTILVKDIVSGVESSNPDNFKVIGDYLLFHAYTPDHGVEPWVTDGTSEGTLIISDMNEGALSSSPEQYTLHEENVFFIASTDIGRELWKVSIDRDILVRDEKEDELENNSTLELTGTNIGKSVTHEITIENIGIQELTLLGETKISLSGSNASDFVIDESSIKNSLKMGEKTSFNIVFTPSTNGVRTAQIEITSNDIDEGTYIIKLEGVVEEITSVDELINNEITVYPNPVNNELHFVFEEKMSSAGRKIVMYNMLGNKVGEWVMPTNQDINVSRIPKGLYIVEVTMDSKVYRNKIFKN